MEKLKKKGARKSLKVSVDEKLEKLRNKKQKLKKELEHKNAAIVDAIKHVEDLKKLALQNILRSEAGNAEMEKLKEKIKHGESLQKKDFDLIYLVCEFALLI